MLLEIPLNNSSNPVIGVVLFENKNSTKEMAALIDTGLSAMLYISEEKLFEHLGYFPETKTKYIYTLSGKIEQRYFSGAIKLQAHDKIYYGDIIIGEGIHVLIGMQLLKQCKKFLIDFEKNKFFIEVKDSEYD